MAVNCSNNIIAPISNEVCDSKLYFGEVRDIVIGMEGQTFFTNTADLADITKWTALIDNTAVMDPLVPATLLRLRQLFVQGGIDAPTRDKIELSKDRTIYSEADQSFKAKCFDFTPENEAFAGLINASQGSSYRIWLCTKTQVWGGVTGFSSSLLMNLAVPTSKKELVYWDVEANFKGELGISAPRVFA